MEIHEKLEYILLRHPPVFLEESKIEAISPWGFVTVTAVEAIIDLLLSEFYL